MNPTPTGRLIKTVTGSDLVLTRTFRAPIDDVWASITESERTARWFASWTGDGAPGKTIRFTMTFEDGSEPTDMTIDACEPPHHLAVSSTDDYGTWRLEAHLTDRRPDRAPLHPPSRRPTRRRRGGSWLGVLPRQPGCLA